MLSKLDLDPHLLFLEILYTTLILSKSNKPKQIRTINNYSITNYLPFFKYYKQYKYLHEIDNLK